MTVYPDLLAWVQAAWRGKHGDKPLNVSQLCRESGVTAPAYYRLENGNTKAEVVQKLADYFGVAPPRRAFVAQDVPEPAASPMSLVRDAMRSLQRAEELMGQATPTDPVLAGTEALVTEALVEEEERLTGRGTPGARGRGKRTG